MGQGLVADSLMGYKGGGGQGGDSETVPKGRKSKGVMGRERRPSVFEPG